MLINFQLRAKTNFYLLEKESYTFHEYIDLFANLSIYLFFLNLMLTNFQFRAKTHLYLLEKEYVMFH